jgi:hypothetical integral membrane protein (TIGR02206 family)
MMDAFWSFYPDIEPFVFFSPIHWAALILIAILTAGVILLLGKLTSDRANRRFELIAAALLLLNESVYILWLATHQRFNWAYHLPLNLCDTAVLICIIQLLLRKKSQVLFEVLYFAGLGGAVQALLTPVVGRFGFPHFACLTLFHLHGFLVAVPLYLALIRKMKITFRSLVRFFIIMNGYLAFVYFVNWVIQYLPPSYEAGNYLFISYPPATGSIIDFLVTIFGPSPGYILGLELLGTLICLLLWIPFAVVRKRSARGRREDGRKRI